MNRQVYDLVEDVVWARLDLDPTFKKDLAEFNKAISKIVGKVDRQTLHVLEQSYFDGGRIFGRAMFELGLQLGRDPDSIFILPETDGGGNLVDKGGAE